MKLLLAALITIVTVAQPADLAAVLEKLDSYLERYESELSAVVADEELIQETDGRLGRRMSRRLHSEIAFVGLPAGLEWMGFRNVQRLDGKPLIGVKPLAGLLATTSADALLLAVALLAQPPSADTLRARLAAYLTGYEPRLSELIADELLVQENKRGSRPTGGIGPREYRTIHSEVAFIALPGDAGWLGFRRVAKVGGKPIDGDAASLNAALASGANDDYAKARAMLADSARFNLGTPRTTNLPNLPLELLHQRNAHRFTVRVDGQQHVRGKRTTRLVFVEMVSPTIIRSDSGANMQSTVTAFVEPDGRLWRADVITVDRLRFEHVVSVEFQPHRDLGMLVPATMHEEFFAGDNRDARGEATYRNYRRFQTSARIVPQP